MQFARPLLPLLTLFLLATRGAAQQPQNVVRAIAPPTHPLPPEAASADSNRFSFIVYGDTRGRRDGVEVQYEHSLIVDDMLRTHRPSPKFTASHPLRAPDR